MDGFVLLRYHYSTYFLGLKVHSTYAYVHSLSRARMGGESCGAELEANQMPAHRPAVFVDSKLFLQSPFACLNVSC